jgi:hypothetical protein
MSHAMVDGFRISPSFSYDANIAPWLAFPCLILTMQILHSKKDDSDMAPVEIQKTHPPPHKVI